MDIKNKEREREREREIDDLYIDEWATWCDELSDKIPWEDHLKTILYTKILPKCPKNLLHYHKKHIVFELNSLIACELFEDFKLNS